MGNNIEISYAFVDGAQLTQTLEGFTINANTGEIIVASAPTFSTTPTDNTRTLTIRATDISSGVSGQIAEIDINIEVIFVVDSDGDGLIDINTLEDLNNIRHNLLGTSYKTSTSDPGNTTGCPGDVCRGYELMRDLDFADSASYAGDSINQAWRPVGGDPALAPNPGWVPIAVDPDQIFNTIFEGNGHTIANLYNNDLLKCGLFASIGENASIRAVGIIDGNVYCINSNSAGGLLVSDNSGGTITASYATGNIEVFGGSSHVGGLVGSNEENGTIIASYAAVDVGTTGRSNRVGGLVGLNSKATIIASYATGEVNSGNGNGNLVGGLVGSAASNSRIIASYATGDVNGYGGSSDEVGGLVGSAASNSRIIASYATGDVDGGNGASDKVGGLVGMS